MYICIHLDLHPYPSLCLYLTYPTLNLSCTNLESPLKGPRYFTKALPWGSSTAPASRRPSPQAWPGARRSPPRSSEPGGRLGVGSKPWALGMGPYSGIQICIYIYNIYLFIYLFIYLSIYLFIHYVPYTSTGKYI